MLHIKNGVEPRNLLIAAAIANVAQELGVVLTITSGTDGTHMKGSKHYSGEALDMRTFDIPRAVQPIVRARLATHLGPTYQIITESDHIHIEYDPTPSVKV